MSTPKEVALKAVKEAGKALLDLSQREIRYQLKSSHDILAEGDLVAEKIILESLRAVFPTHSFLSEEAGRQEGTEYLWAIDPVDGTINFSRHIEEYSISVALDYRGETILGIVYQPALDKLYVAERGQGAELNGRPIHVSQEDQLIGSLLATDNSSKLESRQQNFRLLSNLCQTVRHVRIFGSSALHLAKIAEGKLDLYVKDRSNYWDCAAGVLLVQEAGGIATDFDGNQFSQDFKSIVVSNGKLHSEILRQIKTVF